MRIRQHIGNVDINIDTSRIDRNIREAQKKLNEDVLRDTTPYVPKGGTGYLRGSGHIPDPYGGEVVWDANYAHYIYMGELYLAANGSSWAKQYEKKFPSGKPLDIKKPYEDHFFEAAKRDHFDEWLADVRKEIDKG